MPEDTYHHGDLKAQLIEQGLKLLDTEGYNSFTLRKVARLCGVSQTAPYRHFHSKDELIGAIANHALGAFSKQLEDAVACTRTIRTPSSRKWASPTYAFLRQIPRIPPPAVFQRYAAARPLF